MTHYCFDAGSHEDGCECDCSTCIKRAEDLKREAFNLRLSQRIQEVFHDAEFRNFLVKEIKKIK